ncbi:MAG: helix-turn-helix domain-containing protein [Acetobacteraceae bacterium]
MVSLLITLFDAIRPRSSSILGRQMSGKIRAEIEQTRELVLIPSRRAVDSEVIWGGAGSGDSVGVRRFWEDAMGARRLAIRSDTTVDELRRLARREPSRAASSRMYAIAHALDGVSRGQAARLAGMERQALRDSVVRYNAEGLAGLQDRPRPGPNPGWTRPSKKVCPN